jgi:hypothetical protein
MAPAPTRRHDHVVAENKLVGRLASGIPCGSPLLERGPLNRPPLRQPVEPVGRGWCCFALPGGLSGCAWRSPSKLPSAAIVTVPVHVEAEVVSRIELERFVVDNRDLERLESLLSQFNVFEAVGVVRQELRHSDFLAFMLDARQTHGLGDVFMRRLLQGAVQRGTATSSSISAIDLDVWDLTGAEVRREWHNIDILITDAANQLAVIIENKVDASEHSGQLNRYRKMIAHEHPGFRVLALFLTPDGEDPTDDAYIPIDYGLVCDVVERLRESRGPSLDPDIRTLMAHYTQMLRRHIVADSEIAELCRRIYQKHQRALDLIYEHRPDRLVEIQAYLQELIDHTQGIRGEYSVKSAIRFMPDAWDIPSLNQGLGWVPTNRILLFEIGNAPNRLVIKLLIGPGPTEIRQRLFDFALNHQSLFNVSNKHLAPKWSQVWNRTVLAAGAYETGDSSDLRRDLDRIWEQFTAFDLPRLTEAILSAIQPSAGQPAEISTETARG